MKTTVKEAIRIVIQQCKTKDLPIESFVLIKMRRNLLVLEPIVVVFYFFK